MIRNDQELETTLERIQRLRQQVKKLRQTETNPQNYRLSAGGYLAEIDRMNLEVREFFTLHPNEMDQVALHADEEGYARSPSPVGTGCL